MEDMVTYAILIAIAVALILMITGKFLDLSVERQEATQSRATINLLQRVVTEGPFLVKDFAGNNLKLMIDTEKYGSSMTAELEKCCSSLQYDYRFVVGDPTSVSEAGAVSISPLKTGVIQTNIVPTGPKAGDTDYSDYCYSGFGIGKKSGASVPVNICDRENLDKCQQGIAYMETVDSPLSQMAYWVSQVCASEYDLGKRIPMADADYQVGYDVSIVDDRICFRGACKKFVCDAEVKQEVEEVPEGRKSSLLKQKMREFPPATCDFIMIVKSSGVVSIVEGLSDLAEDLIPDGTLDFPANRDDWTEETPDLHFSGDLIPSNENIGNIKSEAVDSTGKYVGTKYVVTKQEGKAIAESRVANKPSKIVISDLKKSFPSIDLDCEGTCVDMKSRYLRFIGMKAMGYTENDAAAHYLFTWKVRDLDGRCVENSFEGAGGGKILLKPGWNEISVDLSESSISQHRICDDSKVKDSSKKLDRTQIAEVEFNICQTTEFFLFKTCLPVLDDGVNALLLDNFRFEVGRSGAQ